MKKQTKKPTKALDLKKEVELLTPQQMVEMEEKLPQWIKEYAADGTSVLRWNQEFLILIEEILRKDHGFDEGQLVQLEKRIKEMLPELHKMSLKDLVILNPRDMQSALGIVDSYKRIEKEGRIILPEPKKFIK